MTVDNEVTINAVIAHCRQHEQEHIAELLPLLAQPSVSAQGIGIDDCASMVYDLLERSGFEARAIETAGAPVIYAERCPAAGPD